MVDWKGNLDLQLLQVLKVEFRNGSSEIVVV
jgi:hypothetical protein